MASLITVKEDATYRGGWRVTLDTGGIRHNWAVASREDADAMKPLVRDYARKIETLRRLYPKKGE